MQFGQLERSFLEDDLWSLSSGIYPFNTNERSEIRTAKEPEQPAIAFQSTQRYPDAILQRFKRRSQALAAIKPNP